MVLIFCNMLDEKSDSVYLDDHEYKYEKAIPLSIEMTSTKILTGMRICLMLFFLGSDTGICGALFTITSGV